MTPSPKARRVASLSPGERYRYFIRKACDFEVVWGLYAGGWASVEADGITGLPLWPEEELAAQCATGVWSSYTPRSIPLDDFVSRWLPGLEADGRVISVFPVDSGSGLIAAAPVLKRDLERELAQYQ